MPQNASSVRGYAYEIDYLYYFSIDCFDLKKKLRKTESIHLLCLPNYHTCACPTSVTTA